MIDYNRKFIFVHIPKTGGSSIESALGLKGRQHLPFKFHTNKLKYFKFTVVRNIYDKLVSWFLFHRTYNKGNLIQYKTTFSEWVKNDMPLHHFPFAGTANKMKNKSPLSDIDFLEDFDGNIKMDYIINFKNLQSGFNDVCSHLNLTNIKLPHKKNRKSNKHYTEYYDEKTKQIVAEKYAKDIEYFGYKFGE